MFRPQNPAARVVLPAVVAATMMFIGDIWLFDKSFTRTLIFALVLGAGFAIIQYWSVRRESRATFGDRIE